MWSDSFNGNASRHQENGPMMSAETVGGNLELDVHDPVGMPVLKTESGDWGGLGRTRDRRNSTRLYLGPIENSQQKSLVDHRRGPDQDPEGTGYLACVLGVGGNFNSVGWPTCGELDIMENIGREPSIVHGVMHGPGYSGDIGKQIDRTHAVRREILHG